MRLLPLFLVLALLPAGGSAWSQESDDDLATKLSNPVASLISVPLQSNYDCCIGPANGSRVVVNLQPVVPFAISDHWNVIARTILPLVQQSAPVEGTGDHFGLGDTTQSFFFSPDAAPGDLIWAIGPAFLWPTSTDEVIGSHKWGAGPTAVLLQQTHGWTFGILANHIWSYSGQRDHPNVNSTFLQPFVGYTWPDTTNLTFNTESNYDWQGQQWTVPLNLTLGHLYRFGAQPINFTIGARYYATSPDGPQWGLRFVITLLFPKGGPS
ncbi:MAG TPA: hypothetical protein VGF97_01850 [Rhizomicrobium sp.]|jgi:hypothetical protein